MSLPANLVVDANPILSALIGGKSLRLFRSTVGIDFHTTAWTISEVEKYVPHFSSKIGVEDSLLFQSLRLLPLTIYGVDAYEGQLEPARLQIDDPKDVDLLALGLTLGFGIWTNDNHFNPERARVPIYRTAQLLRMLEFHG